MNVYRALNATTLSAINSEYVQIATSLLAKPTVHTLSCIDPLYMRVCGSREPFSTSYDACTTNHKKVVIAPLSP